MHFKTKGLIRIAAQHAVNLNIVANMSGERVVN